ncbi:response regulator [Paludibaculum fermentans]|uniref:Response regulator n=1 Tax=Paludibaculum fermentans TaxID=1473598 RepID=A0A7S7NSL3_PALFE|nr:response regulator [Paludibaculum fermentans]QOY88946.1 response regulator [Paludibaculum fermentans]
MPKSTKILAVVDDLFFVVKINDAAKRAGLTCEFLKSEKDVLEKSVAEQPLLVILDLNAHSVNAVSVITNFKAIEDLKRVSLIGFVSHVQGELKQQAQDAGANMVLARSAFSTNLPQILKRHTGSM